MDVFVYFPPNLQIARDEIEDAVEEAISGFGEVTGAGAGEKGSNLDVEIFEESPPHALETLRRVLVSLSVPPETFLVVDGVRHDL